MLLMPALQLRNPMLQLVLMKTNDFPPDPNYVFFHILCLPLHGSSTLDTTLPLPYCLALRKWKSQIPACS